MSIALLAIVVIYSVSTLLSQGLSACGNARLVAGRTGLSMIWGRSRGQKQKDQVCWQPLGWSRKRKEQGYWQSLGMRGKSLLSSCWCLWAFPDTPSFFFLFSIKLVISFLGLLKQVITNKVVFSDKCAHFRSLCKECDCSPRTQHDAILTWRVERYSTQVTSNIVGNRLSLRRTNWRHEGQSSLSTWLV